MEAGSQLETGIGFTKLESFLMNWFLFFAKLPAPNRRGLARVRPPLFQSDMLLFGPGLPRRPVI